MKITRFLKNRIIGLLYRIAPQYATKLYWKGRGAGYINEGLSEPYKLMYEDLADASLASNPSKVLEYGCGYGYLLKRIYEKLRGF